MYFDQKFDIVLTQRVDYHGDGPDRVMALRIFEATPGVLSDLYHFGDYQYQGKWDYDSNNLGTGDGAYVPHTLGTAAPAEYLYWRYNYASQRFDFLQIMPGTDDSPYITLCARLELARPTFRGLEPSNGQDQANGWIETPSSTGFFRQGVISWGWQRYYAGRREEP